jgi:Arc/MetJ-type ribon-helix-helix transcriptional regulator
MVDDIRERLIKAAIPKGLVERVEREALDQGTYSSLSTFIADAVRRRLEELETRSA